MTDNAKNIGAKAQIDFKCLDENCDGVIKFTLADIEDSSFQTVCPKCYKTYELDGLLREKLLKVLKLTTTLREVEDILGDCNIAINVANGEVKIPYALLLTRLNTMISLKIGERSVDFHLRIEPGSEETFR
jgi:hypothetical protein